MIAGGLPWYKYLRIPGLGSRRNSQHRKVLPWEGSLKNNTFDRGGYNKVEESKSGQRGEGFCGNFVDFSDFLHANTSRCRVQG